MAPRPASAARSCSETSRGVGRLRIGGTSRTDTPVCALPAWLTADGAFPARSLRTFYLHSPRRATPHEVRPLLGIWMRNTAGAFHGELGGQGLTYIDAG